MSISPARAAACIRRLLLSWLIAALVQALASGGPPEPQRPGRFGGHVGPRIGCSHGGCICSAVLPGPAFFHRPVGAVGHSRCLCAAVYDFLPFTWPFFSGLPWWWRWFWWSTPGRGPTFSPTVGKPRGQIPAGGGCCRCNGHCLLPLCHRPGRCAGVLSYAVPSFDFGIFSQMFHHMRTTGLPNTTLERGRASIPLCRPCVPHLLPAVTGLLPVSLSRDVTGIAGAGSGFWGNSPVEAVPGARIFPLGRCRRGGPAPALPCLRRWNQL